MLAISELPETKATESESDITSVNRAGAINDHHLSTSPEKKFSSTRVVTICGTVLLAVTLIGSIYLYIEGTQALHRLGRVQLTQSAAAGQNSGERGLPLALKDAEGSVRQLSTVTAAGGVGALVVVALVFIIWRKRWLGLLKKQKNELEELNRAFEKTTAELTLQKRERKRVEEDLKKTHADIDRRVDERTSELNKAYTQLQKELKDRQMAERVMALQAKEVERSKDVLELHVQARTQELQKLQRRFESILNSAGEGIYGLDLQGKMTFVNPAAAKITGWKVEELVAKLESEIFHHLPASGEKPKGEADGESDDYIVFYRRDGSSFPAEYIRTPIKEKDKEVGAVVIFKDITERKRAEEALNRKAAELARSNAELEQFAYVASHDLQEPLRKIQAFGDRLKTKCDAINLEDGRDYLERMQSAAARMQTLINDLLTFSRVISASQPFVPVDLGGIVKGVLSDLEVRIEQTKAKIEVGELPTIDGDPLQMRQLLQNLIGNALKFQAPGAQPCVKIHGKIIKSPFSTTPGDDPYGEQCELSIEDNGIGFDEKYLDKIFAVFQRLHGRNEYEGTGVGLAVCRRITDRHGGTITAKSRPAEGARFIITLPVHHSKKETAP
jgi:PAS domain S-box-containing protein